MSTAPNVDASCEALQTLGLTAVYNIQSQREKLSTWNFNIEIHFCIFTAGQKVSTTPVKHINRAKEARRLLT